MKKELFCSDCGYVTSDHKNTNCPNCALPLAPAPAGYGEYVSFIEFCWSFEVGDIDRHIIEKLKLLHHLSKFHHASIEKMYQRLLEENT